VATIRVHCEARDPCHVPQISYPIPRADRFLPTCVHHRHITSCVCRREKLHNVFITSAVSHTVPCMSTTHHHEWRINLGCSDTLPPHHHSHHTLRMWWASSVASLSHSNRLSNFAHAPPSLQVEESIMSGGLAGGQSPPFYGQCRS
jgi:hypothetical protein